MLLTQADLIAVERELCKRSLAHFAQRAWHVLEPAAELKWGWALDAICQHLEAVTNGEITRLLMNVPPGSMKSLLTGVIWPAWEWGPRGMPWKRFIGTAHEETLAIRDNRKCRDLVKSEWFQKLWPLELLRDLDGKKEFGNIHKGVRQARAFTSLTGVRGDCLLGHSEVITDSGIQTIENIVDSSYSGKVLSYDNDSNKLVYRSIQAVARRSSQDFYRVHFADGSLVECTGDHRIYTSRGYIQARFLSPGDTCLRLLRVTDSSPSVRLEEDDKERLSVHRMLQAMCADDDQSRRGQTGAGLLNMRRQDGKGDASVFARVQSRSVEAERREASFEPGNLCVPGVRNGQASPVAIGELEVLFAGVQGRSPCSINEGISEPGMARWNQFQSLRQGDSARLSDGPGSGIGCGSQSVRSLPVYEPSALPSYRPRFNEQQSDQSCDVVPEVPHESSCAGAFQTREVSVSLVERVCESAPVFDIQVEGTHCFFADGILVHNCVILDDPISADNANSAAKLEEARIAFTETLPTRVNSEKSAIVVVMQRLSEKDVSGVIKDMNLPYVHLCIPMRYEPARKCVTSIGWEDPRTIEGELMFPERFGEAQVTELETTLGSYGSAGQLQQRPAPRGGGIIKESWFRYYSTVPRLDYRMIHADTAQKTGQENDYSVFQCWGRSTVGEAVLIDQIRGKWEAPELLVQARAFWHKHLNIGGSVLRAMMVEDKVSGTGLIQTLRREGVAILPVQRSNDKISRAHDAAPFIESGNVLLPVDAPWLSDFLSEASTFPGGAHDDQLDPLFDAVKGVQSAPAVTRQNAVPIPSVSAFARR